MSLLPPRLTSDRGRSPLPDAVLPGIGAVHALVVPLSLGDRSAGQDPDLWRLEIYPAADRCDRQLFGRVEP